MAQIWLPPIFSISSHHTARPRLYHSAFHVCPKGSKARGTILRCCNANGMPIIVIAVAAAAVRWVSAIAIPKVSAQTKFSTARRTPPALFVGTSTNCFPKGQMANDPSLIACRPNGIPTIVRHSSNPPNQYSNARMNPPKSTHSKLAIVLKARPR